MCACRQAPTRLLCPPLPVMPPPLFDATHAAQDRDTCAHGCWQAQKHACKHMPARQQLCVCHASPLPQRLVLRACTSLLLCRPALPSASQHKPKHTPSPAFIPTAQLYLLLSIALRPQAAGTSSLTSCHQLSSRPATVNPGCNRIQAQPKGQPCP